MNSGTSKHYHLITSALRNSTNLLTLIILGKEIIADIIMPANCQELIMEEHIFAPLYKNPSCWKPGRVFYFSRHGESENNLFGRIGGNAELSNNGHKYAKLLGAYVNQMQLNNLQV